MADLIDKICIGIGTAASATIIAALVGGSMYAAVHSRQTGEAYDIAMNVYSLGKEAVEKGITKENLPQHENQDIVIAIENLEKRYGKYINNYDIQRGYNLSRIPTIAGFMMARIEMGDLFSNDFPEYLLTLKSKN